MCAYASNDSQTVDLALKYGNFKEYYRFNTVDSRLKLISKLFPSQFQTSHQQFQNRNYYNNSMHQKCLNFTGDVVTLLDIGCNSGDLGVAIAQCIQKQEPNKKIYLLGIDLDEDLIKEAKEKWYGLNSDNFKIEYHVQNVMSDDIHDFLDEYRTRHSFKNNQFDCIFCFSITMWIHLNHGDEGFKTFLQFMHENCNYLMFESQPFNKYRDANKRMIQAGKEEFKHFYEIKIYHKIDEFIVNYLSINFKMSLVKYLGSTHWSRNVYCLKHDN